MELQKCQSITSPGSINMLTDADVPHNHAHRMRIIPKGLQKRDQVLVDVSESEKMLGLLLVASRGKLTLYV